MISDFDFEALDLPRLQRLRRSFLNESGQVADYWQDEIDLRLYDETFAQRIAWKWDSLIRELKSVTTPLQAWPILDYGCGTGIASRRILKHFPDVNFPTLFYYDRSPLAKRFAVQQAKAHAPNTEAAAIDFNDLGKWIANKSDAPFILVVSHVINELPQHEVETLTKLIQASSLTLICEPGTFNASRRLIALRESVRNSHNILAPCTHQSSCGILTEENRAHWCHHFGTPPPEVFADSNWVRFSKEIGIDLRSLPYSYLVLSHQNFIIPTKTDASWSRILGRPREHKGYIEFLNCNECAVSKEIVQKRDAKADYKRIIKGKYSPLFIWTKTNGKLIPKSCLDKSGCHHVFQS